MDICSECFFACKKNAFVSCVFSFISLTSCKPSLVEIKHKYPFSFKNLIISFGWDENLLWLILEISDSIIGLNTSIEFEPPRKTNNSDQSTSQITKSKLQR